MYLRVGLVLTALAFAGCGGRTPVQNAPVDDTTVRLGTDCPLNLKQLLKEDRAKLAKKVEETAQRLRELRNMNSSNPSSVVLLPRFVTSPGRAPLYQAKFSQKLGFSVPAYYKEGQADPELALHLARHGDLEAAKKLGPKGDAEFDRQLAAVRTEKNYPIEWTLLVAVAQQLAEVEVTVGNVDGATELASLHRQLTEVLDAKAKSGPLGALLLPTGYRALTAAAAEWRSPAHLKSVLADDIAAVLKVWGQVPAAQPFLVPGAPKEVVARVLGGAGGSKAIAVTREERVVRALDLLTLPVVNDGVDGLVAFLDSKGQLAELQLSYIGRISDRYPDPRDLALGLGERGIAGTEPQGKEALPRSVLKNGGLAYDCTLSPRSSSLGGLVRVREAKAEPLGASLPAQPLALAPLRLDRSFDTNRLLLDRQKPVDAKGRLTIERPETIKNIQQPVRDPLPAEVVLEREKDHDLVQALHFRWKAKQNVTLEAASKLAVPLWVAFGPAQLESAEVDGGTGALVLRWEQNGVAYTLRLPYGDTESQDLSLGEVGHSADALTAREKTAQALDRKDREERFTAGKPLERLERGLQVPGLKLGLSREEAVKLLPRTDAWRQVNAQDSVLLFHLTQPSAQATSWPREIIVRFDSKDRVAELRVLYTEGPARGDARNPGLFEALKKSNGEPEKVPAAWAGLWTDLPAVGVPAQAYRWHDDVTSLQFQRDSFTTELTLKDCPPDAPYGVKLAPLNTIGGGPTGLSLGTSKADVLKKWSSAPATSDGGLALSQPSESKFDVLLVYFSGDKVSRILGRLRDKPSSESNAVDQMLNKFYASQPSLGLLRRRQVEATGQLLGGWGWHDDSVRVWGFGQGGGADGTVGFVEWRAWPLK
jgi:hypothetical protein